MRTHCNSECAFKLTGGDSLRTSYFISVYYKEEENETDISAKEKAASEGTRIPQENVYEERQKCAQEKKRQGQKKAVSIVCVKDMC
jgi:hypothetical protein